MKLAIWLLVPLSACAEQDVSSCSSSAGAGCHGLDLSMIQLDVLGRQSEESSSFEVGERSSARRKALLGFESYAKQLVDKVIGHNLNLTKTDRQAIQTIIDFIGNMSDNLDAGHTEDELEVAQCKTQIEFCNGTLGNITQTSIKAWGNQVDYSRIDHNDCRIREMNDRNETNGTCEEYDRLRQDPAEWETVPPCIAKGHFGDGYITASDGSTLLKEMETCLRLTKPWLDNMYQHYIWCLDNRTKSVGITTLCNRYQNQFEDYSCIYSVERETACDGWRRCYKEQKGECDKTCERVAISVAARKADDETAKMVHCLLLVLNGTDNQAKPKGLQECKNRTYNGTKWDIPCPPGNVIYPEEPPPNPYCNHTGPDDFPKPCGDPWSIPEYRDQEWWGYVELAECQECLAEHANESHLTEAGRTCHEEAQYSWSIPNIVKCQTAVTSLFRSLHAKGNSTVTLTGRTDLPKGCLMVQIDQQCGPGGCNASGNYTASFNDYVTAYTPKMDIAEPYWAEVCQLHEP